MEQGQNKLLLSLVILTLLIVQINSATYNYSTCNSTSYLNPAAFQCTNCLTNQIPNTYQTIPMACQCSPGYVMPTNAAACTQGFSTACTTTALSTSIYPLFSLAGVAQASVACTACASTAYPDKYDQIKYSNKTACTPCGPGMTYSANQGCICSNTNFILTDLGCFESAINPSVTSSSYSNQLKYVYIVLSS